MRRELTAFRRIWFRSPVRRDDEGLHDGEVVGTTIQQHDIRLGKPNAFSCRDALVVPTGPPGRLRNLKIAMSKTVGEVELGGNPRT